MRTRTWKHLVATTWAVLGLVGGLAANGDSGSDVSRVSEAASRTETLQKVAGLPWIGDVTITFVDVTSVGFESFGYLDRDRSLGLITGSVEPVVTVNSWPAEVEGPLRSIKALTIRPENVAAELEEDPATDAIHIAKAVAAVADCRQAALLAASRPDKYSLSLRFALRGLDNHQQSANPAWPNMTFFISEEYFSCRVFRE